MQTQPNNMPIADYCQAMERHEIVVNRDYQRSEQVWPSTARSFLIETLLLGFPMPKLAHYQVTDVKTKRVKKEIVDGQQRSTAILEFYQDKFKLSKTIETDELRGKSYSQLPVEYQQRFLDYSISIDLFVGATLEEVREVFRRINSYTVPLNPEEQRHAEFQGKFKWFVHRLARRFDETFLRMGMFTEKQLVRMQDTKLIADVVFAMIKGIHTTKSAELNGLYKYFDDSFPDELKIERQLTTAFDQMIAWKDIHDTELMRPNQAYALILALVHMKTAVSVLTPLYKSPALKAFDSASALPKLTALAEVLEQDLDDVPKKFKAFAKASAEKTNVEETRQVRFRSFCPALDPKVK